MPVTATKAVKGEEVILSHFSHFARRYLFKDESVILSYFVTLRMLTSYFVVPAPRAPYSSPIRRILIVLFLSAGFAQVDGC